MQTVGSPVLVVHDLEEFATLRMKPGSQAPIQDLLHRIRWDAEFARGEFELGYYDRVEDRIIRVPLAAVQFPPDTPQSFYVLDAAGLAHHVPLHRVREVSKDGQRIWHRLGHP